MEEKTYKPGDKFKLTDDQAAAIDISQKEASKLNSLIRRTNSQVVDIHKAMWDAIFEMDPENSGLLEVKDDFTFSYNTDEKTVTIVRRNYPSDV